MQEKFVKDKEIKLKTMYVNETNHHDQIHSHHEIPQNDPTRFYRLVVFYIGIPICLLAILINLLLIYFIVKYRAFKTRGNLYIFHFCIANILFLFTEFVLHLAMDLFFGKSLESTQWYCTLIQFENYFFDMCIIFVAGYAIDEYILMISNDYFLSLYKNRFKYFLGSIYPFHFLLAFIVSSVCFSSIRDIRYHISFIFVTIIFGICWMVLFKIKIDSRKSKFKQNEYLQQAMSVAQLTLLFFLPLIFYYNVINIAEKLIHDDDLYVLRLMAFISEFLTYCASFGLAYKLYKSNKFYKLAFCKIFCKERNDLDFSRLEIIPEAEYIETK